MTGLVDGQEITPRIEADLSRAVVVGPAAIHLSAGERARLVALPVPVPATVSGVAAAPLESYVIVATDTPGVIARVSRYNTSSDCRSSGILLTGKETITDRVEPGTTAPFFDAAGSWLNHQAGSAAGFQKIRFASIAADDVRHGDKSWQVVSQDGLTVRARFVWGRDAYVNLGQENDGKELRFFVWSPVVSGLTSFKAYLGSYPYGTDIDDDEISGGGTDDSAQVGDAMPGYYWVADLTAQLGVAGRWCEVVARKQAFAAAGPGTPAPIWQRITSFQLEWNFSAISVAETFRCAGIYFGDPPDARVDSVAIMPVRVVDRTGLALSLDAPAASDANVHIMAVIL